MFRVFVCCDVFCVFACFVFILLLTHKQIITLYSVRHYCSSICPSVTVVVLSSTKQLNSSPIFFIFCGPLIIVLPHQICWWNSDGITINGSIKRRWGRKSFWFMMYISYLRNNTLRAVCNIQRIFYSRHTLNTEIRAVSGKVKVKVGFFYSATYSGDAATSRAAQS